MTITYSAADANYTDDRYALLSWLENVTTNVYTDTKGLATIGAGFLVSDNADVILRNMGLGLSDSQIRLAAAAITAATKGHNFGTDSTGDEAALDAINKALRDSTRNQSLNFEYVGDSQNTVDQQIRNTFDQIAQTYEDTVNSWLPPNASPLATNLERLALFSLAYNGYIGFKKDANGNYLKDASGNYVPKSPSLRNALQNDDRAEAWYEIRYNSNRGGVQGVAKRHYEEAALFRLYNDNANITVDDAKSVYQMFTQHRSTILGYDATYSGQLDAANADLQKAGFTSVGAQTIKVALGGNGTSGTMDAKDVLLGWIASQYGVTIDPSISPLDIQMAGDNQPNVSAFMAPEPELLVGTGHGGALTGSAGNDTLVAGTTGDQVFYGGGGSDTYVITANQNGTDTIHDSSGTGKIYVGGSQLAKDAVAYQSANKWVDASNGVTYQFNPAGTLQTTGKMLITSGTDTITIDNFDLAKAITTDGYLGIHLKDQVGIAAGASTAAPALTDQAVDVAKSPLQTFTVSVAAAADKAQTLWLKMTSAIGVGVWELINGAETLPFAADGTVQITIPAGQDSVTLALVDTSNTASTANLKATLTDANGTVTSNNLAVTFDSPNPNANGTQAANTINGDQTPQQFTHSDGTVYYQTDPNGNLKTTGPFGSDSNFNDVLYGDRRNDIINTGTGNNVVNGMGGNDTINGGSGNDVILGGDMNAGSYVPSNVNYTASAIVSDPTLISYQNNGGNGNSVINGGGGQDVIIVGNGSNQIYANTQTDLATALAQQTDPNIQAADQKGDLIVVGDGNNTIVGSNGNDAIFTGAGNNTIVMGHGDDTLIGGVDINSASLSWTENNNVFSLVGGVNAPYNPSATYNGSTFGGVAVGMGNDTIFGGTGNSEYWLSNGSNWLDAGGGDAFIQAGTGSNTIYGGAGDDTIFGGGGSNYIDLESGNDELVAEGGNQTIYGGTGNDTIYSGDDGTGDNGGNNNANISWADSQPHSTNYIEGGSGQTFIYGSGGNDTLISGSESGGPSTQIAAGNGTEYIVGGAAHDSIFGGTGSDTIYAGDGNTWIQLSTDTHETGTVYGGDGSDTILGGAGNDTIFAGDGGTTSAITAVQAVSGTHIIYGGAGVDQLTGGSGSDTLVAGEGTSSLQGGSGTEVMYSGSGTDTLLAGTGLDTLYGGSGTDLLQGNSNGGTTLFVAGSGNETIQGGRGTKTYEFDAGFGNIELQKTKINDTFKLGAGIAVTDLTVSAAVGSDGHPALLIQYAGGQITIDGGLDGAIQNFTFTNPITNTNQTLTLNQLMAYANSAPTTATGTNGNVVFSSIGSDTLVGGTGNDSIYGWNGGNSMIAGSGNQTLHSQSGNDTLIGGAGSDTLISAVGSDLMVGGTGNTTFVVNSLTDVIQAQAGSNINTVQTSVSYIAPANVQNLIGTGSADLVLQANLGADNPGCAITANSGNDFLIGGSGNDTLIAGSGNDTLASGTGISTLIGGTGNDQFSVKNSSDVVLATSTGSNVNTVVASVDYVLPEHVQYMQLSGDNVTGTGNDTTSGLLAIGSNDTLVAGTGVTSMYSELGQHETFVVNNTADVVQVLSAGKNNTIRTSVDYAASAYVQNLTGTGTADITLTGNNLGDVITANSGNDTLVGGSGNDTLIAGAGRDTFNLDFNTGMDTVIDDSSQGGVIRLGLGFDLNSGFLSAVHTGSDLLLQLDSDNSLLIKGYYTNPQTNWTIQDAAGNTTTLQAIQEAASQESPLIFAENSWKNDAIKGIIQQYEGLGYSIQADGTLYSPPQLPSLNNHNWLEALDLKTTTTNGIGAGGFVQTTSDMWLPSYSTNGIPLSDSSVSVNEVNTTSDASVVYADSAWSWNQDISTKWLQMSWIDTTSTSYSSQQGSTIYTSTYQYADGVATGVLSSPGNLQTAGSFPQAVQAQLVSSDGTSEIQQINLGTSGQTVYAGSQTLVISNSGNDTIFDAGFAYGGSGNDTMIGGGTLLGGTGNDLMEYGNNMTAGAGNDTLIGGNIMVN